MAYGVNWNEASPIGATTPAADIDTELQNLKISIRERMNDLIGVGNWENDGVNPKVIATVILSHVHAESAGSTTFAGGSGALPQTWSENINVGGDITIAGSTITFDTAGTYAFWVTAAVGWQPYTTGGGNEGLIGAIGTATFHTISQIFQLEGFYEVSIDGVIIATAGQTMQIQRQAAIAGGADVCRFNDMSILIIRLS